ncbi:MAG: hypothetical protein IJF33_02185, partial [Clostridia bacterium]|nr:hypothetical protein [Clostridia bacterium]
MGKKKFMRILFVLLTICLVFPLAACKNDTLKDGETVGYETVTDDPRFVKDDLPSGLSFSNAEVRWAICAGVSVYDCFFAEAQSPNVIDNVIYEATGAVEDRLDIVLSFEYREYDWETRVANYAALSNEILNGISSYDIITSAAYFPMWSGQSQMMVQDIGELDYIDLDKPWWTQNLNKCFGDKVFLVSGDAYLGSVKNLGCLFFNQDF